MNTFPSIEIKWEDKREREATGASCGDGRRAEPWGERSVDRCGVGSHVASAGGGILDSPLQFTPPLMLFICPPHRGPQGRVSLS
jgi:hypothetical protein